MKKTFIFCILTALTISASKAQKYVISYGPVFGLNISSMDSKAFIDYDNYPFNELDRNFSLSASTKNDFGYQGGIFFRIKPVESRLNLETNILIASFNNSYTLTFYREAYYSTPWTTPPYHWAPESEAEYLQNEFSILTMPVILGYDFIRHEKYSLALIAGISLNIAMKNEQSKIGINLNENKLYKKFYLCYQPGIRADFNKIICTLKYERSLNIQNAPSRDYFPWEMNVEKLYVSNIRLTVGYEFNSSR